MQKPINLNNQQIKIKPPMSTRSNNRDNSL